MDDVLWGCREVAVGFFIVQLKVWWRGCEFQSPALPGVSLDSTAKSLLLSLAVVGRVSLRRRALLQRCPFNPIPITHGSFLFGMLLLQLSCVSQHDKGLLWLVGAESGSLPTGYVALLPAAAAPALSPLRLEPVPQRRLPNPNCVSSSSRFRTPLPRPKPGGSSPI